jgi:hypothetical protein
MASLTGLKENATRVEESRYKAGDKSYYYFNVPSGEEAAPKARQAVMAHTTAHRPAFSVGMHRRHSPSAFAFSVGILRRHSHSPSAFSVGILILRRHAPSACTVGILRRHSPSAFTGQPSPPIAE